MTESLARLVARELEAPVPADVATLTERLAGELGGRAVLYYGSTLRTGDLSGILDFYVLTETATGSALRRAGTRWLWPDVSYHEVPVGGRTLRAKVAAMPIATFARAALGESLDTTVWARFVQPAALVWAADAAVRAHVREAVADAAVTAARFAAVLGPGRGTAADHWRALFRATYRTELRVEPPGREAAILNGADDRYAALLRVAWTAAGIAWNEADGVLAPHLDPAERGRLTAAWRRRVRAGKALNAARLVKAAFTFAGAARYGLWKIERHTGLRVELTPWRERHPVLAAPGVLWRVLRHRAA